MPTFTRNYGSEDRLQEWLPYLVHLHDRPALGLEIGVFEGRSTLFWLEHVLLHPYSRLICVDPFVPTVEYPDYRAQFLSNVQPERERIRLIECHSTECYAQVWAYLDHAKVDFCYIDGAHDEKSVWNDLCLACLFVKRNGLVIIDDTTYVDVHLATENFLRTFPERLVEGARSKRQVLLVRQ